MPFLPQADLRALFEEAVDLPPLQRAAYLREVQFKYPGVYRELRELLLANDEGHEFFEALENEGNLWGQFKPPSLIGRRFGSYVVEREIGRGGMGAVYLASRADEVFYKTVAIKVISGGAALSESALEAFRRERQILAQLEHPNIARLLDAGATDDGLLYLIMEYVDGLPLDVYIQRNKLGLEAALDLFLAVCEAVAFAHRNLVVHRDLKPSNILVDGSGQVKLLDFGIAKVLSPGRAATATVAVRLTPEFASPEQIRGSGISTVSDVYSLGVVLFHLVTAGARPYRTTSEAVPELLQAVLESETPRPSAVAPAEWAKGLRGDLDNIILKAMAKEAERRYASVERLGEDIKRHRAGLPVYARPATLGYRAAKFWQRNRLAIAAAGLLLLAIGSGIFTTLQQAEVAQRERSRAEQERAAAVEARARADGQRQIAVQAQASESALRRVAEERTREAEAERSKAEARYQNVRSLATAILTDVNDALKDLPGSGPARRRALLAALGHLEELSKRSDTDLDLQEDLAQAYEQTGDLMRTLFPESRKSAMLAIPALEKALRLRTQVAAARPKQAKAQLALSGAYRLLGNGYFAAKQEGRANQFYLESLERAKKIAAPEARELQALAQSNLCTALAQGKETSAALTHCRGAAEILENLAPQSGLLIRARLNEALVLERRKEKTAAANLLDGVLDRLDGDAREAAEAVLAQALALPNDGVAARAERWLGVSYARENARDRALEYYEQSLKRLGRAAPSMRHVLSYATHAERLAEVRLLLRQGQARKAQQLLGQYLEQLPKANDDPASLLEPEFRAALSAAENALLQPGR